MMRGLLFLVALSTALTVSASDLETDLKAGETLLSSLPKFVEGPLKTTYFEALCPGMPNGYGVITLSAVKDGDQLALKYETHGAGQFGGIQTTADSTALMDARFHLKSATMRQTTQRDPESGVEVTEEELVVERGRVRARTLPAEQWKEYPLDSVSAVWPTAELLQWVKLGDVTSFALREIDPRGRYLFPKEMKAVNGQAQPLKATGKTYESVVWQFKVIRNEDGSTCIESRRPGDPSRVRRMNFDHDGKFLSVSSLLFVPGTTKETPEVTFDMKVVNQERVEELKRSLQQAPVSEDRTQDAGDAIPGFDDDSGDAALKAHIVIRIAPSQKEDSPPVVTIDKVNFSDREKLAQFLKAQAEKVGGFPKLRVEIRPDDKLPFEQLSRVMTTCTEAGVQDISARVSTEMLRDLVPDGQRPDNK
jgi:hypothetical protein